MVRFSLPTVLGPLNKGQEETWIPRDDQPVSWGRIGHCSVRSKAKSKGQNYPKLHKNVRRTCSHQKQQILLFSLQLQVITIYRLFAILSKLTKQNKNKKNMNKERCMCIANHQKQWQRLFRKWWTRGHGPIFIQSLLTGVKGSHLIVTHS